MKTACISSGSLGNCFVVESSGKYIILDCGLPFEQITHDKAFPKFKNISFVFTSHCHHDHNKSLKDFKRSGCEIVSYETLEKKVQHFNIENFSITTYPILHNVDNWGIIIQDNLTKEKLCYMTDFFKAPKVEGISQFIYEVNYIEKNIDAQIYNGRDFKHTGFNHHNSLENAVEYFSSLKTRPKEIIIAHLSKENGDYKQILKTMSQFADVVKIADKEK